MLARGLGAGGGHGADRPLAKGWAISENGVFRRHSPGHLVRGLGSEGRTSVRAASAPLSRILDANPRHGRSCCLGC